jgi:hypothetical protein
MAADRVFGRLQTLDEDERGNALESSQMATEYTSMKNIGTTGWSSVTAASYAYPWNSCKRSELLAHLDARISQKRNGSEKRESNILPRVVLGGELAGEPRELGDLRALRHRARAQARRRHKCGKKDALGKHGAPLVPGSS